jgi:hypothetical protein
LQAFRSRRRLNWKLFSKWPVNKGSRKYKERKLS